MSEAGSIASAQPVQPKKRKRVFMWSFLVIQAIFLIWIIAGIAYAGGNTDTCGTLSAQTCADASNVGTAIGVGLVIGLWVAVDVILGISRLIVVHSRRK